MKTTTYQPEISTRKEAKIQTDSEIIEEYKSVKIKLTISLIFLEFGLKGKWYEDKYLRLSTFSWGFKEKSGKSN